VTGLDDTRHAPRLHPAVADPARLEALNC